MFLVPAGASAATIVVNATHDLTGTFEDPGGCNLRDAVTAANANAPFSQCPGDNGGGTGADTIVLQGGQTYTLTNHAIPENANASGDLDIAGGGGTTIRNNGAGLATIDADSNTSPGPPDNQRGRAIDVLAGAGAVRLERIRIRGGTVSDGSGGGGIKSLANLTLTDSEVIDNGAFLNVNNGGGGILVRHPGRLTLTRSTVANNVVKANPALALDSARGGGIEYASANGPFNATNSTISGNQVDSSGNTGNTTYAGGIYWLGFGATMNLTNVTISNNSAVGGDSTSVFGGGMVLFEENATLQGTILAGNQAPARLDCDQIGADDDWISAGGNVIGDTSACGVIGGGNDLFNASPSLGPLSNYGGLTRTQLPNPGSPAINHGGTCPATDQRGFFRAPVAPCDAGAVEVGAPASLPPTPPPSPPPQAEPENNFSFGKAERNKKKGTATLPVEVPGPGHLELAGKGLKPSSADASDAGDMGLAIKAIGRAKKKLRKKGKKKVTPSVTFTPTGGSARTESTQVKLVKK